jgi:hypothetical protein
MKRSLIILIGLIIFISGCEAIKTVHERTETAAIFRGTVLLNGSVVKNKEVELLVIDSSLNGGHQKSKTTTDANGYYELYLSEVAVDHDIAKYGNVTTVTYAVFSLGYQAEQMDYTKSGYVQIFDKNIETLTP